MGRGKQEGVGTSFEGQGYRGWLGSREQEGSSVVLEEQRDDPGAKLPSAFIWGVGLEREACVQAGDGQGG